MIRTILIDDEQRNIENLQGLLQEYCPAVQVIATAMDVDEAVGKIRDLQPDLLLLDIHMPGKNGFEVLKALPDQSVEVIFVTAFDQYAIQAIKFSAIDYLLKPVDIDDLKTAIAKVETKIGNRSNPQVANLLEMLKHQGTKEEHRLALSSLKETRFVRPADIIRCESSNAYTSFFLVTGESVVVSRPIFEYSELLADYGFIRCHQSHLINRKYIKSLLKEDSGYLLLEDDSKIPISRNKKETVLNKLLTHFK
ncbi:DNA-binding response regulator [Parapedobacter defluvii]|uniref:DNA-binding response regulator n=1 Tax=Parapedobacter defluvii TaxID=2045106 RepID=A0ABQ1M6T7_9SPHI|nr:LytTR family DNA-binding domain-containing protein [Parapedobacter defluvii]RQP11962.1 MAG: DNA-binding response regulator [Parapedobacter sp.]GGC35394.1 DNA-binding response regulator [Parapedobacter defluvii]